MLKSSATLLISISVVLLFVEVECRWVMELALLRYRNNASRSGCCDDSPDVNGCSDECDNFFTFCLQNYGAVGLDSCIYGRYDTGALGGNNIVFRRGNISSGVPNPLVFNGNEWPNKGRLNFAVLVSDKDDASDVNRALLDFEVTITSVPSNIMRVSGIYYELQFEYQLQCAQNYYGPNCSTQCIPQDDSYGHYDCDSEGNRYCLPGYTGEESNCTTAVVSVDCEPECGPNAECNATTCQCIDGWTSKDCSVPICNCNNGGSCVAPNTCNCLEGWTGLSCDTLCSDCSTSPDSTMDNGAIIGSVFGMVFIFAMIAGLLSIVLIFVVSRRIRSHRVLIQSKSAAGMFSPGDNPNYSLTSMGSPTNSTGGTPKSIKTLDNPLYGKSNSTTNIVAGYSLVTLPGETDESVYYSSTDSSKEKECFYDSLKHCSEQQVGGHCAPGIVSYYSQPALDRDSDQPAIYEYVQTRQVDGRMHNKHYGFSHKQ